MTLDQNVKQVATQIAATQVANGRGLEGMTFEELVSEVQAKILALAKMEPAEMPTLSKAARKPKAKREKAATAFKGVINTPDLEAYLQAAPRTLADVSDSFKVSTGVAKRAIKALGDKVVEGKVEQAGKKGKPATTYRIEG
jgi:response regulator of citrate/malate metabolism